MSSPAWPDSAAPPPTTRCPPPTPAPRSTAPSARRSVNPRRARHGRTGKDTGCDRTEGLPRYSLRIPRLRRRRAPGSGRRRSGCREVGGPGDRHRCQRHQPAPVGRRHGRGQRPGHDAGRRGRPGLRAAGGRIRHGRSVGQDGVQLGNRGPNVSVARSDPRAGSRRRSSRRAPSPGRRSPCRAATRDRCGSERVEPSAVGRQRAQPGRRRQRGDQAIGDLPFVTGVEQAGTPCARGSTTGR